MSAPASTRPGVVMVTGAYFPELSGGGLQCRTIVRALAGSIAFRVLTTCTDPALPAEAQVDEIAVTRLFVDLSRRSTKIAAACRAAWFFLRRHASFQIVHLHGFSQKSVLIALLARLFRKKLIVTIHTADHDEPQGVRRTGRLAYWCYSHADLFATISAPLAERYLAAGLPADRLWPVQNGVDVTRFRPADPAERLALRQSLGLDDHVRWILFVGFFSRDKAPDVLFDAWLTLVCRGTSPLGLVFVGDTASAYHEVDPALVHRMRGEADARGLTDRVVFTGTVADIERYYRAADLFVMPSVREAFGMALVEAMSCGLPVIASRIPGVTDEIVGDGVTGVLVPPRDVEALADALTRLLDDPSGSASMGARARAAIERRFAVGVVVDRWRDAYAKVLS